MDLEKLDLEEVDKEMAADKAAQSSVAETDAPENAPEIGGAIADAWTYCQKKNISFFPFFFFLGAHVLVLFVNLTSEKFALNFGNNNICPVFMGCWQW